MPFDPAAVEEAAQTLPRLHSLLVSWRGTLVLERYYNGAGAHEAGEHQVRLEERHFGARRHRDRSRLISGVDQPIAPFFPDLLPREDDRQARDHDRGSADDAFGPGVDEQPELRRVGAEPELGAARPARPLDERARHDDGYSTGNTHLLSAILTKATGTSTWQFAQEALAKPLGFSLARGRRIRRASTSAATTCC